MTSDKDQFIGTYEGFKVLWLDYEQGGDLDRSLSTCFFLPDEWDGLRGLMEKACSDPEFLKYHVPYNKVPVGQFRIPKFKILSKFDDLTDHLHNLGVPKRCLLEVAENELISVSRIIQKAFVEINKEGTEAAAVTAMVGRAGCAMDFSPPKYVDFVADHPFMLVI
ncbi:serpin-ZX-like [Punica granatum]|nr:serpin-ZX-like [Punica granatum]